jgi:hypothetical protein
MLLNLRYINVFETIIRDIEETIAQNLNSGGAQVKSLPGKYS